MWFRDFRVKAGFCFFKKIQIQTKVRRPIPVVRKDKTQQVKTLIHAHAHTRQTQDFLVFS